MARGKVGKAVRAQNRATQAGNPSRGNPYAGPRGSALNRGKRQAKQGKAPTDLMQEVLVWENQFYRAAYKWEGEQLIVSAIICFFNNMATPDQYKVIEATDPLIDVICKKLLITLKVKEAQKKAS